MTRSDLENVSDRIDLEGFEVRDKFSHEAPNFLDVTVKLDGEPLFNINGTGTGLIRIEPTESGTLDTETFQRFLDRTFDETISVNRFCFIYTIWKADGFIL